MSIRTLHLSAYRAGLLAVAVRGAMEECRRGRKVFPPDSAGALEAARYEREFRELLEFLPDVGA